MAGKGKKDWKTLKDMLDGQVDQLNRPGFIEKDPISIPHRFSKKQDIEIAGLFAALFSWGNRTTIINKSMELLARMDHDPHAFILRHGRKDLEGLQGFMHRTFNDTDLLGLVAFLHRHYSSSESLETAFASALGKKDEDTGNALRAFHQQVFSGPDIAERTRKHIPTSDRGSSCKRLNMYLRWMVRKDDRGVDFGIWQSISPAQLVCPLDLHVGRLARRFGLLTRKYDDWEAALELTANLRVLDPVDPVKYDIALFGMGVNEI
jgi:uncharacterized protein (TIGR02757 family)